MEKQTLSRLVSLSSSALRAELKTGHYSREEFIALSRAELDMFGAIEIRHVGRLVCGKHTAFGSPRKADVIDWIMAGTLPAEIEFSVPVEPKKAKLIFAKTEPKAEPRAEPKAEPKAVPQAENGFNVNGMILHKQVEEIFYNLRAKNNVLLVGPAGSGKNVAARQCADALGIPFYMIALTPTSPKSEVFGYTSATGDYVATEVYRWAENGGVLFADEFDNANPQTAVGVNGLLSDREGTFPGVGPVKLHPTCICVGAANTIGKGGTEEYRRLMQDAATWDRFGIINWQYDETLEREFCHALIGTAPKTRKLKINSPVNLIPEQVDQWVDLVQRVRTRVEALGIRHLISPRASLHGIRMLQAGAPKEMTINHYIRRGIAQDSWNEIKTVL
jgi:MoxR-like ATPase